MTIQKKVLQIAEAEGYGVKETEGQNRGPQIRKYSSVCNLSDGYPWCALFVSWVMKEALKELFDKCFIASADTWEFRDFAEKNNILSDIPDSADIFLRYGSDGPTHTGFVLYLPNQTQFKTCEGNSNSNGSSNGDGIYSNIRTIGNNYRFIKWYKLLSPEEREDTKYFELYLKDKKICDCPVINNKAFAPVREFAEALNLKINVNSKDKKIFL